MLMVMGVAFRRAGVADPRAQLEHLAQHRVVGSAAAQAQIGRRVAHVGAIEAGADALRHVHLLGRAGVGAAQAHLGAIHRMVDGIAGIELLAALLSATPSRDVERARPWTARAVPSTVR